MRSTEPWLETVETDVGARLDRLPWARWHWVVLLALGLVWILDGLEATIVGTVAARLTAEEALDLTSQKVGLSASIYIAGAVVGALVFGYLNDRLGRRRMFLITLSLYLLGTLATATAFSFWSFTLFRFVTGLGIGGEYAAINATIGEFVPARVRGWVYVAVNGSWWLGASFGAGLSVILLDPELLPADLGWRLAFAGGAVLGIGILLIRRTIPESPRWLAVHGRADKASAIVARIEERVAEGAGKLPEPAGPVRVRQRHSTSFATVARTIFARYPRRALLAFALMASQAFFYNAVFYTYGLVLAAFYDVASYQVGLYLMPIAAGNFVGPLVLGPLFDSLGRRTMLSATYLLSGAGMAVTGWLFHTGHLSLAGQTVAWSLVFFLASAGASAAYLTISEIFPVEVRALAIALFYSVSTGAGGISGPALFGSLVAAETTFRVFVGYLIGAGLMVAGGAAALLFAVPAERKPLEEVAPPLGSEADRDEPEPAAAAA